MPRPLAVQVGARMIRLDDVAVTFNAGTVNEVRALRDLSLTLADGEFVTVVGLERRRQEHAAEHARRASCMPGSRPGLHRRPRRDEPGRAPAGTSRRAGVPEPARRHGGRHDRRGEPGAGDRRGRRRGLRQAVGVRRARARFGELLASVGTGPGAAAQGAGRAALGRTATGADAADGDRWPGRASCCWTSTRPRSIRPPPPRSRRVTVQVAAEQHLTTLMVTHNMQQALASRHAHDHAAPGRDRAGRLRGGAARDDRRRSRSSLPRDPPAGARGRRAAAHTVSRRRDHAHRHPASTATFDDGLESTMTRISRRSVLLAWSRR